MSAFIDCLAGEVTESELFTDGVDMIHNFATVFTSKLQTCPHSQQSACFVLMQRALSNSTPAPLLSNPTVTQTISVFDSLKIGPSAQRAWFQRMVSKSIARSHSSRSFLLLTVTIVVPVNCSRPRLQVSSSGLVEPRQAPKPVVKTPLPPAVEQRCCSSPSATAAWRDAQFAVTQA